MAVTVTLFLPSAEGVKTTQHSEPRVAIVSSLGLPGAAGDREKKSGEACDQEEAEQAASGETGHGCRHQTISRGRDGVNQWWETRVECCLVWTREESCEGCERERQYNHTGIGDAAAAAARAA